MSLAGWDVEQQTQSIGGALKFTEATGLDLAHGVDLITDSMGALNIETEDLDGYLDSLVATQSNSNTTAEEMMQAYIRAGSTMSSMNFTVDETNAMLGVLADNGIKGAEAGTKLNSIFAKMVNPTGQTAKAFEELDISMANADGTMKSSDEILAEIKSKTEGLTEAERNRYVSMIAGTENLSSMNTLLDASGGKLEEYIKLNEESNGALDELHTIIKDNLKGDFEEFKSSLEATALSIGEMLLPTVRDVIQWLTDMVTKFNDLSDGTKGTIVAFGGVAAAIPPILVGVGGFLKIVGSVMTSLAPLASSIAQNGGLLKTLGMAFRALTGPIGIAVTVIGLLITAFTVAYTNSETFRNGIQAVGDKVRDAWEYIKEFGSGIKALFTGSEENGKKILSAIGVTDDNISRITGLRDNILEVKDRVLELGSSIADRVRPALEEVMNFIGEVGTTLVTMWEDNSANIIPIVTNIGNGISNVFKFILATIEFIMPAVEFIIQMVWENIKGVIRGGLKIIEGLIKTFSGLFTGDFSKMWEGVKDIFFGAIQFVWNLFQLMFYGRIIKGVGALVKGFGGLIKGLWTKVTGFFKGMYEDAALRVMIMRDTVVNFIKGMATGVRTRVGNLVTRVKDFFVNMYTNVTTRVSNLRAKVSDLFSNLRTKVVNTVNNLINRVKNFFVNMYTSVTTRVGNLRSRASEIFNNLRTRVVNTVKNLIDRVKNFFSNMYHRVRNTISNLRTNVVNGFNTIKDRVIGAATGMKDKAVDMFNTMKDKAKEKLDDLIEGAKELPGKIKDAIIKGKDKAVDGIKELANSMGSKLEETINGVIGGLNSILSKLGIDGLKEISIPKFSTGTGRGSLTRNGAIAQDTLATVGDKGIGNGSGTRELVQYPNGITGLYDNDATIFAPKGTIIWNNKQTEEILAKNPQFSTGTVGGSGTTKKTAPKKEKKGFFGTLADIASNVWDFIKEPSTVLNTIIDEVSPDFSGLKGFAGTLVKGGFDFFKGKALDWITGIFKDNEGGNVDGSSILSKPIYQTFGRYKGNIGFNGGKHYGVDTGHKFDPVLSPTAGKVTRRWTDYGGGNSLQITSDKYIWWFMHLSKILKDVGDAVKVGDKVAVSGSSGNFVVGTGHLHTQVHPKSKGAGNHNAIDPMPLLKGKMATGGFATDGLWHLGEEGYGEWVIPTDPKRRTDAMKLLAHAGKSLQKNNGTLRPNNLPNIPSDGNTNNDIAELKEMVANQQEMISLLAKIAEKDYVALYDKKKMAKELEPEITKRTDYNNNRQARFS